MATHSIAGFQQWDVLMCLREHSSSTMSFHLNLSNANWLWTELASIHRTTVILTDIRYTSPCFASASSVVLVQLTAEELYSQSIFHCRQPLQMLLQHDS